MLTSYVFHKCNLDDVLHFLLEMLAVPLPFIIVEAKYDYQHSHYIVDSQVSYDKVAQQKDSSSSS